ncbi:MAG: response regulator [bacterium]|nr:response regulator [bacterium]
MKILLVEDDPLLIDIYTTKLQEAGFSLVVVSDGAKVVEEARAAKPDIVLLDIVLPNVDGWEVLRSLKADNELKNIKVIILSNLGQKEEVEKGLQMGAARYLIKAHYTPSQVAEEIQNLVSGH